jgi:hypothetical protein
MMVKFEESTVVGAMFLSPMRMDMQVPDVLMSVMTHGTVVTNMIPLHAAQAGLVTSKVENASWLTQETVLVASPGAKTTADHTQDLTHTDATLPAIPATPVSQVTLDVVQTGQLNAEAVSPSILPSSTDATKPIQIIHSANHVTIRIRLTVTQEPRHATVALHHQNSSHVTPRHSPVSQPTTPEISNRPVTQVVDTSPQ